jgi:hypothetical protein
MTVVAGPRRIGYANRITVPKHLWDKSVTVTPEHHGRSRVVVRLSDSAEGSWALGDGDRPRRVSGVGQVTIPVKTMQAVGWRRRDAIYLWLVDDEVRLVAEKDMDDLLRGLALLD